MKKSKIVAAVLGGGNPYPITLLYSDDFTTDLAAGAVNGTAAEPGPGIRTVTDADGNKCDIDGGLLRLLGMKTSNTDPRVYFGSVTRAAGLAQMTSVIYPVASARFRAGFGISQTASPAEGAAFIAADAIFPGNATELSMIIGTVAALTPYQITTILRGTGVFFVASGGGFGAGQKLIHANNLGNTATLYTGFGIGTSDSISHFDYIRTAQLGAPWNGTYGPGALVVSGAIPAAQAWAHDGNALIYFTITAVGTAGSTVIKFRMQDANNYWMLTIGNNGVGDLSEVVATVVTSRGTSAAGVFAAGERCCIQANGQKIRILDSVNDYITYASAVNFATATAGELTSLATDAVYSNLEIYPVDLSGAALAWLTALESALP